MINSTKLIAQVIVGMTLCWLMSCTMTQEIKKDSLENISDAKLRTTLQQAFTAMGGLENWQQLQSLKFRKKTVLYLASGEIEKKSDQQHHYEYNPTNKTHIHWKEQEKDHVIEMIGNQVVKKVNQQIDPSANTTALKNTVLAATFVMGVPFKIMDEGVQLNYEGLQTIQSGKTVHVVKATYNPNNFKNHTKSDIWWHYFDKNTYEQVGYAVQLHDHTSYIENLTYERVDGFLFTTSRKSWRINEKGEKLYLRAEYEYLDFEVE